MKALRQLVSREKSSSSSRRSFLRRLGLFGGVGLFSTSARAEAKPQPAGLQPFIGEIILFAGNFAPRDWALCDGQILQIQDNQALFSLLGTTYGGDGRTTFALPDLRGRAPIHAGTGPGLTNRRLGSRGGFETVALTETQLPGHTHTLSASTSEGGLDTPEGGYPARPASGIPQYADQSNTTMAAGAVGSAAQTAAPHENMPPYLTLNYIIATVGVFPSRN